MTGHALATPARRSVEVAIARAAALRAVSTLIAAAFERSIAGDLDPVGRVAFRMYVSERSISARLAGGALGLVARQGGLVVGYAEVQGRKRHLTGRDHLSLLFVEPDHQRRGIGRALLRDVVRRLALLADRPAQLTVHAAPASVRAYERMGFEATGPITLKDGLRYRPMVLRLSSARSRTAVNPPSTTNTPPVA
ncbi:MAG TPA: GNAT family N-acetyltransferase [Geminicoccaceae bacterium]|nr:GNAT family N-acetyltransferase [Geminicoccus sp.]HMU48267.1 GNAT family N-acetyltransferase [Geminicoccaceae bacterium]